MSFYPVQKLRSSLLLLALVWPTMLTWLYLRVLSDGPEMVAGGMFVGGKMLQFGLPLIGLVVGLMTVAAVPAGRRWFWSVTAGTLGILMLGVMGYMIWGQDMIGTTSMIASAQGRLSSLGITAAYQFIGLAVFYALIHSLLEEMYWRWFVYGGLKQRFSWRVAAVVSAIGFTAHHVVVIMTYWNYDSWLPYLLIAGVLFGGLAWGYIYERTKSVTTVWVSHALIDAMIFIVGYQLIIT